MKVRAGAFSDTGRVREGNEDAHVIDERLALFAVADGMGGHRGGEVASWTAIEALRAAVASGRALDDAIELANDAVIERAGGDPELAGMGTTMTAAVVAGGRRLLIGHVGDSRAYMLRGSELRRLTEDHSLVEELMREGRLTPEQAEAHPQRAVITRALGVDGEIDVDVYTVEVEPGDRIVLCSDGLTTMVREPDIARIAVDETDTVRAAEALVDAANAAGGEDNTTVVVLDVLEVDDDAVLDPDVFVVPAPGDLAAEPRVVDEPDREDAPAPRGRRVRNVLLVAIPLLVIAVVAVAAVGWYARRSYYVGVDGGQVVLFKGVPGGVLGWDPTVEARTGLAVEDLAPVDRTAVRDGAARGSRDTAERFIDRLEERVAATSTTTTSSTTTSTTSPTTTTVTTAPPAAGPPGGPAP